MVTDARVMGTGAHVEDLVAPEVPTGEHEPVKKPGRPPANADLLDLMHAIARQSADAPVSDTTDHFLKVQGPTVVEHADDSAAHVTAEEVARFPVSRAAERRGIDAAKIGKLLDEARRRRAAGDKTAAWLEPLREAAAEMGLTSPRSTSVEGFRKMLAVYRKRSSE